MSVRVDSSSLITGAVVVGDPGLGVLAEMVPSTGEHGAGYLYASLEFPADTGKEVRGLITTWPTLGTLTAFEDSSFEYDGPSDTFAFQMYVDGVAVGTPQTVTIMVGAISVAGSFAASESGGDSAAFVGQVKVSGGFSLQESGQDTALIVGGNFLFGSFFAQEPGPDTATFSGRIPLFGAFSAQETGSDSAALSGAIRVRGSFAVTESGQDAASFAGSALGPTVTITTAQAKLLFQIYLLHGLHSDPLQVSPTSRSAGLVQQSVSTVGGATLVETLEAPSTLPVDVGLMIEELAALHGLTETLSVTADARVAGGISQSFSTVAGVTTVTRL